MFSNLSCRFLFNIIIYNILVEIATEAFHLGKHYETRLKSNCINGQKSQRSKGRKTPHIIIIAFIDLSAQYYINLEQSGNAR